MNKLVVIVGPTASGKSALAVQLAKKFRGEVISADSRQAYKGLDVGSGKISRKEMQGIPHHLLGVASPKRRFTVAQFQKLAQKKIKEINGRKRTPFLVGGTGFYIKAVVDGVMFPHVPPSRALRARLEKKSASELFAMLKKLDPDRARSIDAKNPRRLIRAIEIVKSTGKPVPQIYSNLNTYPNQSILQIGIKKTPAELKKAIHKRLLKRLGGMIAEVRSIRKRGVSWKRLEELGLEYKYTAQYLQKKITKQEMIDKIQKESEHFAKRQMTWFKRDKRIHWIKTRQEAEKLIKKFMQEKSRGASRGSGV